MHTKVIVRTLARILQLFLQNPFLPQPVLQPPLLTVHPLLPLTQSNIKHMSLTETVKIFKAMKLVPFITPTIIPFCCTIQATKEILVSYPIIKVLFLELNYHLFVHYGVKFRKIAQLKHLSQTNLTK